MSLVGPTAAITLEDIVDKVDLRTTVRKSVRRQYIEHYLKGIRKIESAWAQPDWRHKSDGRGVVARGAFERRAALTISFVYFSGQSSSRMTRRPGPLFSDGVHQAMAGTESTQRRQRNALCHRKSGEALASPQIGFAVIRHSAHCPERDSNPHGVATTDT